jgi:hypothetical protein
MSATQETIHFPIDSGDQAYFDSRKNLLAHEVYERIGRHLHAALDKVERIWREQRPNASPPRSNVTAATTQCC